MADEATRDDEAVRGGPHGDPALMRAWQRTISDLAPSQRAWLRASRPLTLHGSTLIVTVADSFTRTQLESRLRGEVEQILAGVLGHEVRLAVTVDADLATQDAAGGSVDLDKSLQRSGDMSTDPSHER
nr:hypothetical protein [Geodermatophilaceae bacterium]